MMRARIGVPVVASLLGIWAAVGCTGGPRPGGSGGNSTGNAVVDATLPTLYTSLRSGSANIDGSITQGTIGSPTAAPINTTNTILFAGRPNDGTVTSATVSVIGTTNATSGAFTQTTTVNEPSTNFQFMSVSVLDGALSLSVRPIKDGTANLTTGTQIGQFFAILTITQSGNATRLFTNQSPTTMATLVNFQTVTPLPAASLRANLTQSQDYLMQYSLSGSPPVAKLVSLTPGSGTFLVSRTGGPTISQIGLGFTSVTFAGVGYSTNGDVVVPIANDLPGGIAPNAALNIQGATTGGVTGNTATVSSVSIGVRGPFVGTPFNFSQPVYAVASTLNGLTGLNDSLIETDQNVQVFASQSEDPIAGASFSHSLDGTLGTTGTMKQALWIGESTSRGVVFWIFK